MEELIDETTVLLPHLMPSYLPVSDEKNSNPQTTVDSNLSKPVAAANGVSEYFFRDYQDYESCLIFYVVHTANRFIHDNNVWRGESGRCSPPFPTTIDGLIEHPYLTPEDFLSAAELIAGNMEEIPSKAMLLLKVVIDMRERMHDVYVDFAKKNLKASGKRIKSCVRDIHQLHWNLMSCLKQVWLTWDGDAWLAGHEEKYGKGNELARQQADEEMLLDKDFILGARFVPSSPDNGTLEHESTLTQLESSKTTKPGNDTADPIKEHRQVLRQLDNSKLEDLAQENVEDFSLRIPPEFSVPTDYHMAYICLMQQANEIRAALGDTWQLVAQGKVPLTAAAFLTHIGIATINYHEGAINKIMGLGLSVYSVLMSSTSLDKEVPIAERLIMPSGQSYSRRDIFLQETYNNIVDFALDYRVKKNGIPTPEMQATFIEPWDSDPDLQAMSDEQRRAWLRTYTVRWLYDFVNFYVVSYREYLDDMKGSEPGSELLDRNLEGVDTSKRRLMGLNDLSRSLGYTILDFNKHPEERLLFGQVFQIQCLVDAFLATRGWQFNPTSGQEFRESTKYDAVKDIESFFNWPQSNGFGPSFADARRAFYDEAKRHRDGQDQVSKDSLALCQQIMPHFSIIGNTNWRPAAATPPRMFEDPDGIWRYSPFLSGSALVEALVIGSAVGQLILDRHTEVFAFAHLQNMLLKKGVLKEETKLYGVLCSLFKDDLFPFDVPKSDFKAALHAVFQELTGVECQEFLKNASRSITTSDSEVSWTGCHVYNRLQWAMQEGFQPSLYQACSDAEFLIDDTPYSALSASSYFATFKMVTREICGMDPQVRTGDPDATPEVVEILKGFYTAENADKDPSQLPFASTRPDVGNILYRLRCDSLSEPAYSSFLNYPRILIDIINFFQELMVELEQDKSANKEGDDDGCGCGITIDCELQPAQGLGRESRLLVASEILSIADTASEETSGEETQKFLQRIARVMERCSSEKMEEYYYHGHDPATLERVVRENGLKERRYAPECTML